LSLKKETNKHVSSSSGIIATKASPLHPYNCNWFIICFVQANNNPFKRVLQCYQALTTTPKNGSIEG